MFLSSLSQTQKETCFCLAHNVVVSDDELTAGEERMMEEMRREMELSPDFQARYVPVDGMDHTFDSRRSQTIVLIALIRLGYADGAYEIEEQCFIQDLCEVFGLAASEFSLIENWVRRLISLEREALDLYTP